MKKWIKPVAIAALLLVIILAGPRIFYGLVVPYLQLFFLCAPLFIVYRLLTGFWRGKWRRWF